MAFRRYLLGFSCRMTHACDPTTRETVPEDFREFKARLGHSARPCLKKTNRVRSF